MRASIIRRSVPKAFLALVVTAAVGLSAETPLVWQNRGQMEIQGAALAIDSGGGGGVAAGNVCTTPDPRRLDGCNWFVRARSVPAERQCPAA